MKPSNPYNIDIVYYNIVLCCSSISVQSTVSQPSQRCTREQLVDVKTAYIEANTAWNITDTKLLVTSTPVCTWTTIHAAVYTQYSLKQKWFVQQKGTKKKISIWRTGAGDEETKWTATKWEKYTIDLWKPWKILLRCFLLNGSDTYHHF